MAVKSVVKINQMRMRELTQAHMKALEKTAYALQDEIRNAEVIPMMTGALRGEDFFVEDQNLNEGQIYFIHTTPYARRLYYHPEYHFHKELATNAKGKWFEDWITGRKKDVPQKLFNMNFKKEAKL